MFILHTANQESNRAYSFLLPFALCAALFCSRATMADEQNEVATPKIDSKFSHRDNLPSSMAAAWVPFTRNIDGISAELRTVQIYPEDQNSRVRIPGRYYHRPLLVLVESPRPVRVGYPRIVHAIDDESATDGSLYLYFLVRLSTPEFRAQCRTAVLLQDHDNAIHAATAADKVTVDPWPLEHMIVLCRNTSTKEVLGSYESGGLSGVRDDLAFSVKFTPEHLAQFLHDAARDRVEFVFYYTYLGKQTYSGSVEIKGDKDLSITVTSSLTSEQLTNQSPIFQNDRNRVSRNVSTRIERVVRAEHKDLIPLLDTAGLMERMLEPHQALSLEDLKAQTNARAEAQLAAYLKPLIVSLNETGTDSEIKYDIDESEPTKVKAGGRGFTLFAIGFRSSSDDATERALHRLENASGVTFGKAKNEEVYRPHKITYYTLHQGWEKVTFNEQSTVYLSVGSDSSYLEDTAVPAGFTEASAAHSVAIVLGAWMTVRLEEKAACEEARSAAQERLMHALSEQRECIDTLALAIRDVKEAHAQYKEQQLGEIGQTAVNPSWGPLKALQSWSHTLDDKYLSQLGRIDFLRKAPPGQLLRDAQLKTADLEALISQKEDEMTILLTRYAAKGEEIAKAQQVIAQKGTRIRELDKELMLITKP